MINRLARIANSAASIAVEGNLGVNWEEEDLLGEERGRLRDEDALLLRSSMLEPAPN